MWPGRHRGPQKCQADTCPGPWSMALRAAWSPSSDLQPGQQGRGLVRLCSATQAGSLLPDTARLLGPEAPLAAAAAWKRREGLLPPP